MTKTFTLPKNLQEYMVTEAKNPFELLGHVRESGFEQTPSANCIRNILNFSKNLDVHPSERLGHLVYLKS